MASSHIESRGTTRAETRAWYSTINVDHTLSRLSLSVLLLVWDCRCYLLRLGPAFNLNNLHGKNKATGDLPSVPISQSRRDVHLPLVAFYHELHCLGPSLDHLVRGKGGRGSAVVAGVKLLPRRVVLGAAAFKLEVT